MSRTKSSSHSAKGPTKRQLRMGELIRHDLAAIFARGELRDPDLEGRIITCSEVRVSPDLRHATVFVLDLGGEYTADVVKGLMRCRKFLRGEVARHIDTKFAPDLRFVADTLFDEAEKMEALLRSTRAARDEARHDEDGED